MTQNNWTTRFGRLKDVVIRQTKNGKNYATFTLEGNGFEMMGSTFQENLVKILDSSIDEYVRLGGYLEDRTLRNGRHVKSFKAVKSLPARSA